jgi:hypothetical protein
MSASGSASSKRRAPRFAALGLGLGLLALCLPAPSAPTPGPADSYLDSSRLLLQEAQRAGEFLRQRVYDKKLAELVRRIADARLGAAQVLTVPQEVGLAHPHLLLMLEHYERAAAAAAVGEPVRCVRLQREAEDEEQLFRAILRQVGLPLPGDKDKG